jgi:hypothetical protein
VGDTFCRRSAISIGIVALSCSLSTLTLAEVVVVKYRGPVDLSHPSAAFSCQMVSRSSLVRRVCYEARTRYMIISLNGTYYHYCGIDQETVSSLLSSGSMGRYYNRVVKGRFDCRISPAPEFSPKR